MDVLCTDIYISVSEEESYWAQTKPDCIFVPESKKKKIKKSWGSSQKRLWPGEEDKAGEFREK